MGSAYASPSGSRPGAAGDVLAESELPARRRKRHAGIRLGECAPQNILAIRVSVRAASITCSWNPPALRRRRSGTERTLRSPDRPHLAATSASAEEQIAAIGFQPETPGKRS